nr:hypothetical protein [Tanacetum cinerariifolium]
MSSDNAPSAVTYTSISSDSDGPSWGIPLMNAGELSEMDPYEEVAQQGQAPPLSPAYVPDPMELDEHVPVHVLEPEHSKYHVPSDDDMHVEDQPYADDASRLLSHLDTLLTQRGPYCYPANEREGDDKPSDDDDDDDEDKEPTKDEDDDEEEEEHLALADSFAVPVVDSAFKTYESAPTPRSPQTRIPFSQTRLRK